MKNLVDKLKFLDSLENNLIETALEIEENGKDLKDSFKNKELKKKRSVN